MRRVLNQFPDRVLLGEIYLSIERLVAYYGRDLDGVPRAQLLHKQRSHALNWAGPADIADSRISLGSAK
jgi:hypothetical protein